LDEDIFQKLYDENREEWEPRDASGWFEADPLLRALRGREISTPDVEATVRSFHHAWIRLPPGMRSQIAREREIAASLVESLPEWRTLALGLHSIGVGMRGPEQRLTAVITVDYPLTAAEWNEIRQRWAKFAQAQSRFPAFRGTGSIPIAAELRPAPTLLGQVPSDNFLFGEPDPPPQEAPVLQSGDKVGSESPTGIREYGTLTCLVSEPHSIAPLLLASGHVFRNQDYAVVSNRNLPVKVGKVKVISRQTDIGLAELSQPYLCDYRVKGVDIVPASPVIATSDMPVQMYGAVSGYKLGYLNQAIQIPANATAVGMLPTFAVDIPCAHGDSGALLVSGRGAQPAVPEWQRKHMSPAYLESLKCAMLGVLKAGPPPGADPNLRPQAIFVPMLHILNELGIEAWVR